MKREKKALFFMKTKVKSKHRAEKKKGGFFLVLGRGKKKKKKIREKFR